MMEQGVEYAGMRRPHRRCSGWRLALAVTMPYVVAIACMAFTFYWCNTITSQILVNGTVEKAYDDKAYDDIFIKFDAIADILDSEILEFKNYENKMVHLVDNKKIHISCNGPYILHMYVCIQGLDDQKGQGSLELRLAGTQTVLTNFTLEAGKDMTCKGLQDTVYLRKIEMATLHFTNSNQKLKIKTVSGGLHYLLGKCWF